MGTLVRTPCQNKKSREPSSQDFWQGHKWLGRRTAPPMRFPDGKHARLRGSPYESKRPPNGGLLFWQGHKWLTRRMVPLCVFRGKTRSPLRDPHTKIKDHRMVVFYFGRGAKARTLDTRFWRPRKKSEKSHKYAILLKMTYILTYRNRRKRGFALFRLRFLLRFALYL